MNLGSIFSLLYTNLVVLKELFENDNLGKTFFNNFSIQLNNYFKIIVGEEFAGNNNNFLKKLGNTISHVNFEWYPNRNNIKLWNINGRRNINFEVKSDLNKLAYFALRYQNILQKIKHF